MAGYDVMDINYQQDCSVVDEGCFSMGFVNDRKTNSTFPTYVYGSM